MAGLAVLLLAVLVVLLRRDVALPAHVASLYADMMADTLTPEVVARDPTRLSSAAAERLGFTPRILSLSPDFELTGVRAHPVADRAAAVWFYRDRRADMLLALAFEASLSELGPADEVRTQPPVPLHIFRKTTQTLVFWEDGSLVYGVTSTLPGERAIAVARRLAESASAAAPEAPSGEKR